MPRSSSQARAGADPIACGASPAYEIRMRGFLLLAVFGSALAGWAEAPLYTASSFAPHAMVLGLSARPPHEQTRSFHEFPSGGCAEDSILGDQPLRLTLVRDTPFHPQDRAALQRALFRAVADGNRTAVSALLAEGAEIDGALPWPAEPDFRARFRGSHVHYYITAERGLTPLMLAAGLGDVSMVKLLMGRGASPAARTRKHKTFALWLAAKGGHVAAMQELLGVGPGSEADRLRIEIDLATQTATLTRDGTPDRKVAVCTGRRGFPTPAGEYVVTDKHRTWRSTLYPADMPYFLRLSCGEFGLHEGHLPGYPASHGCIRLHPRDAAEFFKLVPVGTRVLIK